MPIRVGTRFGAYEVASSLGSGGMGEVYRARDTNLKRDVALKTLPPAVANDADRLARFQREAEVLASLNHPNIAHIYGLERSEGTTALAMELIEGATLEDRISQGRIPGRFLMIQPQAEPSATQSSGASYVVVQNFTEEFKRRVRPSGK